MAAATMTMTNVTTLCISLELFQSLMLRDLMYENTFSTSIHVYYCPEKGVGQIRQDTANPHDIQEKLATSQLELQIQYRSPCVMCKLPNENMNIILLGIFKGSGHQSLEFSVVFVT